MKKQTFEPINSVSRIRNVVSPPYPRKIFSYLLKNKDLLIYSWNFNTNVNVAWVLSLFHIHARFVFLRK